MQKIKAEDVYKIVNEISDFCLAKDSIEADLASVIFSRLYLTNLRKEAIDGNKDAADRIRLAEILYREFEKNECAHASPDPA